MNRDQAAPHESDQLLSTLTPLFWVCRFASENPESQHVSCTQAALGVSDAGVRFWHGLLWLVQLRQCRSGTLPEPVSGAETPVLQDQDVPAIQTRHLGACGLGLGCLQPVYKFAKGSAAELLLPHQVNRLHDHDHIANTCEHSIEPLIVPTTHCLHGH